MKEDGRHAAEKRSGADRGGRAPKMLRAREVL
jgi:hypothetical protein